MSDDKQKRDFRDRNQINQNEDYEARYRNEKFGVTREQLAEAIAATGSTDADRVEQWLGQNPKNT